MFGTSHSPSHLGSSEMPSRSILLRRVLVTLFLGMFVAGGFVACGDGGSQYTPCTSVDDCLGDEVCYNKECRPKCTSDDNCLGFDACNVRTGLCGPGGGGNDGGNQDKTVLPPQCGNGQVEPGEQCDGTNLFGQSCQSKGFAGGTLKCTNCNFDTSGCQQSNNCGNGTIDLGEECDGANLNGQTCQSRGFQQGTLKCSAGCRYDTSACGSAPKCGNGALDPGEDCDGANLNNQNCQSQGFNSGNLSCTNGCRFDTSLCQQAPKCGNGAIDSGEECDGTNLNNATCQSKGFSGGSLRCTNGCKIDTSACTQAPKCGNGAIDSGEQCDGTNLNNETCQTKGFSGGSLRCSRSCTLDTSGCTQSSKCGNGQIDTGEQCDGSNLSGKTCKTEGFDSGTLKCNACKFDTSACQRSSTKVPFGGICASSADCASGPCLVRQGESKGYCSKSCTKDADCPSSPGGAKCNLQISSGNVCGWSCTPGGSTCPTGLSCAALGNGYICLVGKPATTAKCGDGKVEGAEQCDGTNLNSTTCKSLGYDSGTLSCAGSCSFDTSKCKSNTSSKFGKPCQSTNDCGANLICVTYAQGQSYCTASCSSSKPCPKSPPGATCSIQLQSGGNVCGWATSTGGPPICGNGVLDPGEECDKTAFGATCKGMGYSGGTMKCSSTCKYVKTSCTGTTKCTSLPPSTCTSQCTQIVEFTPIVGAGYRVRHGSRLSWARRSTVIFVKYAAASVDCVYPGTKWLGLGDMSMQNGGTPADTNGRLRHPQGTHVQGRDMDIGYYQKGLAIKDNDLRPVCAHTQGGRDQYHCVSAPTTLDADKSAFFIAKLIESNQVRVIGVDGKIGPLLKTSMTKLYNNGMITKAVLDQFPSRVTWEETDKGRGWFRFHHHHLHVSFR